MKTPIILLVDDEESIIDSMKGSLEDEGYIVITAIDGMKALDIVKAQPIDMVFLDIWLPEMDGLQTLKAIKDYNSAIEVVMMTGHGTVNTAVQAVKQGAFDFLEKPFSLDTVIDITKKITEKQKLTASGAIKETPVGTQEKELVLTGNSHSIAEIRDLIPGIAQSDEHILLRGEVGTGKDFVSEMLHRASPRKAKDFHKINCSFYLPDDIEEELFGSSKKTGKDGRKRGTLDTASAGTVFLDALDALCTTIQKRLAVYMSDSKGKGKHVRIMAATTREEEKEGSLDRTLIEELAACFAQKIDMPPLRNRRSDIPQLIEMFIEHFCKEYGLRLKRLDNEALEILVNYDWPGNVKELKNLVEKLVVSVPTKTISSHDIPLSVRDEMQYSVARYYERYKNMQDAESAWRKNYILYHMRKNRRDLQKTAKMLKIKNKTLEKYIKDYDIVLTNGKIPTRTMQRTLKRSMVLSGRGLHSGDKTGLIITPLPPNSGIFFGSISSGETLPANIDYVESTDYATSLKSGKATARTIEHLLSVLHAYKVTNLMIKINNEVPIMDGSAVDFCQIIEDAGIEDQDEPLDELIINKRYTIGDVTKKSKFIIVEPSDNFTIHYTLRYPKPVGTQEYTFCLEDEDKFKKEIAPARTFAFLKDIEALESRGLAGGGRLNNFILIDDEKIVNTDLRFPDEFVRHKILDMMGDLYLLGRPLRAKITANMTGHTDNISLVKLLSSAFKL